MLFSCCVSNSKVSPKEVAMIMDQKRAEKYGISYERYHRILALPQMTRDMVENMYVNGWDFTDTSRDLELFTEMQRSRLESIKEQHNEDD